MSYFEKKYESRSLSFRYAIGNTIKKGNEIHPYHELLYYIDGNAVFTSEKFKVNLNRETLIFIPKNSYHQLMLNNLDNYERLSINFDDIPELYDIISETMTDIKIVDTTNTHIADILNRAIDLLKMNNKKEDVMFYLYGALLIILSETNLSKPKTAQIVTRKNTDMVSLCIDYINSNYYKKICVDDIARAVNCSSSSIQHEFKKEMGVSIYKYITEKRLIKAYNLINENYRPTQVFYDCGFSDYSSFYKAYVKKFKTSPKNISGSK